ncbi:MAG: hypothetical protein ACT4O0_08395 [Pseudonocardia sp.]
MSVPLADRLGWVVPAPRLEDDPPVRQDPAGPADPPGRHALR